MPQIKFPIKFVVAIRASTEQKKCYSNLKSENIS